jgi:hypothetical protein
MNDSIKQIKHWKRILLVFLIVFNAILLSACSDSDLDAILNFLEYWSRANQIMSGDAIY